MMVRFLLMIAWLSAFVMPARAETVVFAAASLKGPLDKIVADFGDTVVSYGGSGTLARQITQGAPADVVILANMDWMDMLRANEDVQAGSVADIASNQLVLIGAVGNADISLDQSSISVALGDGRLAVGQTQAVPAGIYAKQALESLDLWDALAPKLAEVDNVRSALTLVIRGQTPLGIVYVTDAQFSDAVRALATFPADSHAPIRYIAAVTTGENPRAQELLDTIRAPAGQAVLAEAGFLPPVGLK